MQEAGAEGLSFELVNRNVDQPYKYDATWVIDPVEQDRASRHAARLADRSLARSDAERQLRRRDERQLQQCGQPAARRATVPAASVYVASYGQFDDQPEIDLYDRMLRETDFTKQRALMRDFEKHVLDDQAHEIFLLWYYRIVPYRSYVKGWKISPSHYLNQDLATVWLDK